MKKWHEVIKALRIGTMGTRFGALILIALGIFFSASSAHAADIYVAQNSAGGNSGADCADARGVSTLAGGDWTAGNTIHLCGTFNVASGGTLLTVQGSGTSGNPITLLWESGAIVQSPVFSSANYGINVGGQSWIVLNGGSNGIIQNTANGTSLGSHQSSTLIGGLGNNDTIENLSMLNVYVHANGDGSGGGNYCILARGVSNLTVGPNNTFTQADVGFLFEWNGGESNLVITGNSWSGINQDIEMGPANSGASMTNVRVDHNTATNWVNWDEPGDGFHHNFFHPFTNLSGASMGGTLQIYDNILNGNMGATATSMIFLENNNGGAGGSMGSWYIFNNVFDKTNANVPTSSGMVAVLSPNGFFYNNTVVDAGGSGNNAYISFHAYSSASGWTLKNNIFQGGAYMVFNESSSITASSNDYYNSPSGTPWIMGSAFESSLGAWQSACSCDSSSITSNPMLTSNLSIQGGSPAGSIGASLTSAGIAALDRDIIGALRPTSGWSLGAYQSGSSSSAQQTPNPPTGLTAVAH